jgi:hypothetical protein
MAISRLTDDQELEARHLEEKIKVAIEKEVADLARLLVSTDEKNLFGATEFQVRELVLRIGAKAYSEHLREKKTATNSRPSIVPAANKRQAFKISGRSSP